MSLAEKLQHTLQTEIPLTSDMGIRVASYDGKLLQLTAPLAPNINHKCTAFGGSLYALAVSCGWGMLYLKLEEAGLHAQCRLDDAAWQKFMHTLSKHGKARIKLGVVIVHQGMPAVAFAGSYVVYG